MPNEYIFPIEYLLADKLTLDLRECLYGLLDAIDGNLTRRIGPLRSTVDMCTVYPGLECWVSAYMHKDIPCRS